MKNISRFVVGVLLGCALPVFAQPDEPVPPKPAFTMVSPEEAAKLGLSAKPMTFHLQDSTLKAALTDLQKQSGVSIDLQWGGNGELDKKLSLDLETRSFKDALHAMLDKAGVKASLQRWDGNNSWHLQYGAEDGATDTPQSGVAAFSLRVTSLTSNVTRSVVPSKAQPFARTQTETLSVTLTFASDPQLPIVKTPRIRLTRAEDEAGRSLLKTEPNFNPYGDMLREQADVALEVPEKSSRKIAHLEGVATYVFASKREHWEVADLLNAKTPTHTFTSNGKQITASVVSAEMKKAVVEVEFQIKTLNMGVLNDGQNQQDTNPLFSFQRLTAGLSLRDSKGVVLSSGSVSGSGGGAQYTLQLHFTPPATEDVPGATVTAAGPYTLVFDAPSEFVATEVPFSFSDLPLP